MPEEAGVNFNPVLSAKVAVFLVYIKDELEEQMTLFREALKRKLVKFRTQS